MLWERKPQEKSFSSSDSPPVVEIYNKGCTTGSASAGVWPTLSLPNSTTSTKQQGYRTCFPQFRRRHCIQYAQVAAADFEILSFGWKLLSFHDQEQFLSAEWSLQFARFYVQRGVFYKGSSLSTRLRKISNMSVMCIDRDMIAILIWRVFRVAYHVMTVIGLVRFIVHLKCFRLRQEIAKLSAIVGGDINQQS